MDIVANLLSGYYLLNKNREQERQTDMVIKYNKKGTTYRYVTEVDEFEVIRKKRTKYYTRSEIDDLMLEVFKTETFNGDTPRHDVCVDMALKESIIVFINIFEFDSHRRIIKNSIVTNQVVWLINNEGKTVDRLSD